jgi:hypothetical protein
MKKPMTDGTRNLFFALVRDAGNWNGTPMITCDRITRGNLTDLKRRGLVTTFSDNGAEFADFTAEGVREARRLGLADYVTREMGSKVKETSAPKETAHEVLVRIIAPEAMKPAAGPVPTPMERQLEVIIADLQAVANGSATPVQDNSIYSQFGSVSRDYAAGLARGLGIARGLILSGRLAEEG